ncbi:MAG: flagellar export protein FliJ [Bdellovibrionaceae bacterium]|nr:flagellar export protein FliJ [Pseudobdellovibrionaceae bacterium]
MKFKFSLEKLLNQRHIQVNLDRRNFVEKQNEYNAEVEKLESMIALKNEVIAHRHKQVANSSQWQNDVEQMNLFLSGQDLRIASQNKRLIEIEKEVEFLRQILLKALTEARMVEKLKEKKKEAFIKEALATEQKELDEIVSMRNKPMNGNS